ncbi:MAG: hypothetical protein WD003_01010 [Candidatus Paceibacterota bacterium]
MHSFFKLFTLYLSRWREGSATERARIGFIIAMQLALLGALFLAIYERAWLVLFICIIAFVIVWTPFFLTEKFYFYIPLEFEFLLNIFIYTTIFLGEIRGYYTKFWWWDMVLHLGSGIALGFLGFLILYVLYRSGRFITTPFLLSFFSFCFALALGALWEIFEFSMDSFFGFTMQNSLADTMRDLIADTLGAFIAALSGYFYIRYQWHGLGIFEHYLNLYFSRPNKEQ